MLFPTRQELIIPFATGFFEKALQFAQNFTVFCLTDGNFPLFEQYPHQAFATSLAIGNYVVEGKKAEFYTSFEEIETCSEWLFGYFSYDMKNQVEKLASQQPDKLGFPIMYFFVPQHIIFFEKTQIRILSFENIEELLQKIYKTTIPIPENPKVVTKLQSNFSKSYYITAVEKIKQHILEGDVYELNFCMEFFLENMVISPKDVFLALKQVSPMPFATFFNVNSRYIIGASPERFLKKEGNIVISQPIKGTSKRGKNAAEDELLKQKLRNSEKEIAENMMIVDLVRNDLAKTAKTGTIKATELFGIYTFPQVHQMISTVQAEIDGQYNTIEIIKNAFPMGSMTGAPKIKAMELIEMYEKSKRGVFSGTIGYIKPNKDFDFNVVIRSIFYHAVDKYLTFQAGSAITFDAIAEQEYEECLLKTKAIRQVLGII